MLADAEWLAPFFAAAETFIIQVPLLQADENWTALAIGMRTYRSHARVQEAGCTALLKLVGDPAANADTVKKNQDGIVSVGGIIVILAAMRAHAGDANVQVQACCALQSLSWNNDNNQLVIAGSGGIIVVVAAMTAHEGLVSMQLSGCLVLRNVASHNSSTAQESIASAGGIDTVVAAMGAHTLELDLQEQGCAVHKLCICIPYLINVCVNVNHITI